MGLSRRLKWPKLLALRISQGSLFQSLGAENENKRSPKVARLLKVGYFSSIEFLEDLRLCVGTGLGCKSSVKTFKNKKWNFKLYSIDNR